ncbi:hypothetical protein NUSPORA_01446 [Nucleospora cyclopteri]
MAQSKKIEKKKTEKVEVDDETKGEQEELFLAEVISLHSKIGSGGSVRQCRVSLKKTGRVLFRPVYGPVRVGDLLQLRECVRESRKLR